MTAKENVTIYKCDFCRKKLMVKHAMVRHEKWCESNPENFKKCSGCVNLQETTTKIEWDYSDQCGMRTFKAFRCTNLDKLLYQLT